MPGIGVVTRTYALTAASANNIAQSQSPGAGVIALNGVAVSGGVATLDAARRVIVTSGGNDTGITFTVTGTDRSGYAMSETITGASGAAATTTRDFKTVSAVTHTGAIAGTVTVGTSSVGSTAPIVLNAFATYSTVGVTLQLVSGAGTASIEVTSEDFGPDWNLLATTPTWTPPSGGFTGLTATTFAALAASTGGYFAGPATMARLTILTGTGTWKLSVQQMPGGEGRA